MNVYGCVVYCSTTYSPNKSDFQARYVGGGPEIKDQVGVA